MPGEPTLLRTLITARHWQRYETFAVQFKRAAKKLADEEGEEELSQPASSNAGTAASYGLCLILMHAGFLSTCSATRSISSWHRQTHHLRRHH